MSDEFGFNQQPEQQPTPQPEQQGAYAQPVYTQAAPPSQPSSAADQGQYGYGQQAAYAPPPPTGGYAPPPAPGGYIPPTASQIGKGGGWITFLRVLLWIFFGLICLFGVVAFVGMSAAGGGGALTGFLVLVGCVFVAFASVAGGMVALDAAMNISRCATNSARILDLLQRK